MDVDRPGPGEELRTSGEPSVPRQAASVIVLRGGADALEVLLVRRTERARFMGGVWVFPGGAVDAEEGEGDAAHRLAALRELEEEAGLRASEWREVKSFYTSPGFAEEKVTIYFASGLERVEPDPDEGEEIELVEWPLGELDRAIDECADAKSLIGLLLLRRRLNR